MSKSALRYGDLPKLQKKIVLCLAEHGVMNISETNKRIEGHESATNLALHKLESKEMVQEVETYVYRGREFPKYWLSDRGVAFALMNGVKPSKVERTALGLGREKTYFELRSISPKVANILDTLMLFDGKLNPEDLTKRIALEVADLGEEEISKFLTALRESGRFDDALERTRQVMTKLVSLMEKNASGE